MKATVTEESEAIRKRFFQAIEALKEKKLCTRYAFAKRYGLDRPNFLKLQTAERQPIPGWYLAALVRDYGVNAEWLLLGTGEMFR